MPGWIPGLDNITQIATIVAIVGGSAAAVGLVAWISISTVVKLQDKRIDEERDKTKARADWDSDLRERIARGESPLLARLRQHRRRMRALRRSGDSGVPPSA